MTRPIDLDTLRRYAVARSLFSPASLPQAPQRLGFVQADPIRAPARAQDLTLRHRVVDYRAGDLERQYPSLDVDEDVFVNYGFLTRSLLALMHPRSGGVLPRNFRKRAQQVLDFVRERGQVHPREVDAFFAHGSVVNYWGGSSRATTQLLDLMHYRGLLRVARRVSGIRVYAVHEHAPAPADAAAKRARIDALIDAVVGKYAPLPALGLNMVVSRLRYGAPQFRRGLAAGMERARKRLARARVDGVDWYWPPGERLDDTHDAIADDVRLLAPFDPVVWDRRRFALLWGWAYRFEAYTPAPQRKLGYYALPLLWRDRVVGWGNAGMKGGELFATLGYASGEAPKERAYQRALDRELVRMRVFLGPGKTVTTSRREDS